MVLNPGAAGDGLRHAFNQNHENDMDQQSRAMPTPTGLNPEEENPEIEDKSFVQCNPNPNLYNTENGNPPVSDTTYVEGGSTREQRDVKRLSDIKLGQNLMYPGGEGTVVARENFMLKIADNDSHVVTTVPVSETYFRDDILSTDGVTAQLWDLMAFQARTAALNKANIKDDVIKAYLYREWHDIPDTVQDILKEVNYFDGNPHGGVEGREPDFSGQNEESRSFRDVTQLRHVTEPYQDKAAPAFKSDVEHNALGGVVTDTPIDATDEYEDDRPGLDSKPLSGADTLVAQGPTGQAGTERRIRQPKDLTDEPTDPKWNEEQKGEQQQAAITGKPDMKSPHKEDVEWGEEKKFHDEEDKEKQIGSYPSQTHMPTTNKQTHEPSTNPPTMAGTTKDEDRGVASDAQGFQGAKPNQQAREKGEQQQAAITGKPDLREGDEEVEKEGMDSGTSGATGPTYADGPKRNKASELSIKNKYNSRWGVRRASEEDIKRLLNTNP